MPAKIAIVVARFNQKITQSLLDGCLSRLAELGVEHSDIQVVWVPGAVEIPLIAKQFAKRRDFAAVIMLGAVIRGQTGHYDFVCKQVSDSCQQLMLQYEMPIVFGVLTTDNIDQAMDRAGGGRGNKGRDCADCAMEMITLMKEFEVC